MRHILLLTDFSDTANNAINYALNFFKNQACHFHILHVHKSGSFILDDLWYQPNENLYNSIIKDEKANLNTLKDKLYKQNTIESFEFSTIVDYDNFTSAIKQIINKYPIELIVTGYNGPSNLIEHFFGSNTIQVIKNIDRPMLIIPEKCRYKKPENLLLVLNDEEFISDNSYKKLNSIIKNNHLNIHAIRVFEHEKHALKEKDEIVLKNNNIVPIKYYQIQDVSLESAITTYKQIHDIDIISLFIDNKNRKNNTLKNVTKSTISKRKELPLLIV
ncbi:hypothetical protein GCM10022271_18670 [Corallibacter vietnamensis]|uniref:UspA domain-containing protein n=1 Tax=Corallibacter vietnamensis TaxID=904130 RepID=A0ABP7H6B4_9FLAO